jgi:hypothetical protein
MPKGRAAPGNVCPWPPVPINGSTKFISFPFSSVFWHDEANTIARTVNAVIPENLIVYCFCCEISQ